MIAIGTPTKVTATMKIKHHSVIFHLVWRHDGSGNRPHRYLFNGDTLWWFITGKKLDIDLTRFIDSDSGGFAL